MISSTLADQKRDTLAFLVAHFKPLVFYVRESQLAKQFWRLYHKRTSVLRFLPFQLTPNCHEVLGNHQFSESVRATHLVLDLRCMPGSPFDNPSLDCPDSYSCVDTGLQLFKDLIKAATPPSSGDANDNNNNNKVVESCACEDTPSGIFFPIVQADPEEKKDVDAVIRVQPFGLVSCDVMLFIRDLFEDAGIATYYTVQDCLEHKDLVEIDNTYHGQPFPAAVINHWAEEQVKSEDLLHSGEYTLMKDYFVHNPTLREHLARACKALHSLTTLNKAIQQFELFTYGFRGGKGTRGFTVGEKHRWRSHDNLWTAKPRRNTALPFKWWCNATRFAFRGTIDEVYAAEGGFSFYTFKDAYLTSYKLALHAFEKDKKTNHPYDGRMDIRGEYNLYKYDGVPTWVLFMLARQSRRLALEMFKFTTRPPSNGRWTRTQDKLLQTSI